MLTLLIVGLVALLFLSAILAPLESLAWWSGWSGNPPLHLPDEVPSTPPPSATHYVVYLSGIGAISGTSIPAEEVPFIEELHARLPNAVVIDDIFPYSINNNGLTGQRALGWFWRKVEALRLRNENDIRSFLVNTRNMWQMLVSADRRYGPVYNLGVAQEIWHGLVRHGYPIGSGIPVTLVGWSGGAQIALGASSYLAEIGAPIYVISVGGVLSDDRGLERVKHLWHLYGEKDLLQKLAGFMYSGRWVIAPASVWNRARTQNKITWVHLGGCQHNGIGNYFDMDTTCSNGEAYGVRTLTTIVDILTETTNAHKPSDVELPSIFNEQPQA